MVAHLGFNNVPRITLTGNPQKLSDTSKIVTEFSIFGLSSNSGDIFIGGPTVNSTNAIPRAKEIIFNFYPVDIEGRPKSYDLSKIYVTGTAGDIVVVQYVENVN